METGNAKTTNAKIGEHEESQIEEEAVKHGKQMVNDTIDDGQTAAGVPKGKFVHRKCVMCERAESFAFLGRIGVPSLQAMFDGKHVTGQGADNENLHPRKGMTRNSEMGCATSSNNTFIPDTNYENQNQRQPTLALVDGCHTPGLSLHSPTQFAVFRAPSHDCYILIVKPSGPDFSDIKFRIFRAEGPAPSDEGKTSNNGKHAMRYGRTPGKAGGLNIEADIEAAMHHEAEIGKPQAPFVLNGTHVNAADNNGMAHVVMFVSSFTCERVAHCNGHRHMSN